MKKINISDVISPFSDTFNAVYEWMRNNKDLFIKINLLMYGLIVWLLILRLFGLV
jgi:hypothetical protein